jgi:hypothetical protein
VRIPLSSGQVTLFPSCKASNMGKNNEVHVVVVKKLHKNQEKGKLLKIANHKKMQERETELC